MRLRHFLILLFVSLALIPVALFRAWPESAVFKNELENVHEKHLLLARNLAEALERYHRDVSNTFRLVISTPDIWNASDRIADTLANLGFIHICIADQSSGALLHQIAPPGMPCPEVVAPDLLSDLNAQTHSDLRFTEITQAHGLNIMRVVKTLPNGRIAFGDLRTDYFIELGQAISFGKMGHAAIVDHAGNVLYHPLADWTAMRRNIAAVSAVQRMMNGETGVEVFYSPALKDDMIAGFAHVSPVGWGVMIPQPLSELQEKADFAHRAAVFVLFVGLACAFVMALIASVISSRPIEQISSAARRIANGESYDPSEIKTSRLLPKELRDLHSSFRNMVKQLRKSIYKINKLAFTDSLTQLANRESFRRHLCGQFDSKNKPTNGALLFIDLDGFKFINDTQGHEAGDVVLKKVANHISQLLGQSSDPDTSQHYSLTPKFDAQAPIAARLGGDEFAIFLPEKTHDEAAAFGERILEAIGEPTVVDQKTVRVGASIGIARFPDHGTTFSDLLKAADLAMYDAKHAGKNQVRHYSHDFADSHAIQSRLGPELAEGFALGQFDVHFQPVYDAHSMDIISVEALLRWQHPTHGLLEAESFLEAAAQFGFQRQIDMFAFEQSMAVLNDMAMRGAKIPAVSLNFWVDSFSNLDFVNHIIRNIAHFPCPLSIELVNPHAQPDSRSIWGLDRLREAGVGIDLDDFGTDTGSVARLVELQPQSIKIGTNITGRAAQDLRRAALLASIIDMAHAQGIQAGAKGIDSLDQVVKLREMGCDMLQGQALNAPMTHDELFHCLTYVGPRMSAKSARP
ncbi:MAG: EAL domain-containing protein [Paracoccaceae bacterium]